MNSIILGLDDPSLNEDMIREKLEARLELLDEDEKHDLEAEVDQMLDDISDNTSVTSPLYKMMALVPSAYFLDVSDTSEMLVKLGKTVEILTFLSDIF
jgi:hypothetical protein